MTGRPLTGVTAAEGFSAAGLHCGIRRQKLDLALLVSDRPAAAAAVFTRNRVRAAPLEVCRAALERSGGRARAVVVNSGNANACTGDPGLAAARRTARETARVLGIPAEEVLVSSTGVIGQPLPVDRLVACLPAARDTLSPAGGAAAAEAIMTTDTRPKEAVRRVRAGGGSYTVGAMAKGSGMVHPDMATTLGFVTTDVGIEPGALREALRGAVDRTFNRITVDGDTSTNDMVAVLANGASGVDADADPDAFGSALHDVLADLARAVARDGEGATRLVTVRVTGGRTEEEALQVARTVAGSLLVRTAVHGADANWGRIVAAAGRAGVELEPQRFRVTLNGLAVLEPGWVSDYSEEEATARLSEEEVTLSLDLGAGSAEARVWTCDLSDEYVRINASYRS